MYINPFTFEVDLKNLMIKDNKEETLLYFQNLNLDFELLDLFMGEIRLQHLFINNFKSSITLYENNKFNFTHILEYLDQSKKNDKVDETDNTTENVKEKQPVYFIIERFSLSNTNLIYTDRLNKTKTNLMINKLAFKFNVTQEQEELNLKVVNFDLQIPSFSYVDKRFDIKTDTFINTIAEIQLNINENLTYTLSNLNLTNQNILFKDNDKDTNTTLSFPELFVSANTITNKENEKGNYRVSLRTPTSGKITIDSSITQNPLNVEGKASIETLTIVPYNNYIKDFINLDIKQTIIDTTTSFNITNDSQRIDADLKISDIDFYHQVTKEPLLKLNSLSLDKIHYTNNNLEINSIILDKLDTQIKIAKDKTTNIDDLMINSQNQEKEEDQENKNKEKVKQEEKSPFQYYIKKLELRNSIVAFSDHSLPLNFDTNIHTLNATVEDISSNNQEASVLFDGVVEKYGLANIEAKTTLADFKNKTDVSVNFENLDVRSYSPYSGKFIGQKIADGKLWLNLNYKIEKGQLLSTNSIKLKNLTLGENVKSEDAMSLPIGLAIALLEDADGLIEVDVPVTGNMNNPQFELSGVIWKTIGNVITNIVSAPFKFLGSILGIDSDELGKVEFKFANSKILPPQKEKLDALIGVLQKKRNLIILLTSMYDKKNDTKALQEIKFQELITSNDTSKMIHQLYIQKYNQESYKSLVKNTKKENVIEILSNEIKKTIIISQIELENLAKQRVQNIQQYFLANKLTLDRIQIKNDVKQKDSSDDDIFTLPLELNIKDN